jgi:hypothetical protein
MRRQSKSTATEPSFFIVAFCFVLMLCACALCSVLMLCAYRFFMLTLAKQKARSTKHAHGADEQQQQARAPAHKNRVFLSRTAKHKAQSMSTKQPIMTKRCDFELKAGSTKHEHKAATKKLGSGCF